MEIGNFVDLVLLVIAMCLGVFILSIYIVEFNKPIIHQEEDKSIVRTEEELLVDDRVQTGKDVLMSLVVADELIAYPRAIRINNTPIIYITDEWLMLKNQNIAKIYSETGEFNLKNMLDWVITDISYVYDGTESGYIQYTLEP